MSVRDIILQHSELEITIEARSGRPKLNMHNMSIENNKLVGYTAANHRISFNINDILQMKAEGKVVYTMQGDVYDDL